MIDITEQKNGKFSEQGRLTYEIIIGEDVLGDDFATIAIDGLCYEEIKSLLKMLLPRGADVLIRKSRG